MKTPLRVILVEDSEDDALLVVRELRRGGFEVTHRIVETAEALRAALADAAWDLVIADYSLPWMSGSAAVGMVRKCGCDLPIILVSGAVGEEAAVAAMRAGAQDFLLKGHLTRLAAVVEHALAEVEVRHARHRAEALLRDSSQRLKLALDNARHGLWDWNVATGEAILDDNWCVILGYEPGELDGRVETWSEGIHPDDRQAVYKILELHLASDNNLYEAEYRARHKQGGWIWINTRGRVVQRDGEGRALRMVGTTQDVTARKNAERELAVGHANLQGILHSFPDLYFWLDPDGTIRHFYAGMETYVPPEQFLNRKMQDVLPEETCAKFLAAFQQARTVQEPVEVEYRLPMPGGVKWFEARVSVLATGLMLVVVREITKRKRAEDDLRELTNELERRVEQRTQELAATNQRLTETLNDLQRLTVHLQTVREDERGWIAREIHDDLGQLLTGIKLDAAWLRSRLSHEAVAPTPLAERVESLRETADAAIQCVRRLGTKLRPGVLDTLGLVAAIEWLAHDFERRSDLSFELHLANVDLEPHVATALFRICQEALTNITRHASANQVVIVTQLVDGAIELRVSDDGQGFVPTELSGQTFGLRGMRERATMLKGTLDVVSELGHGTTITANIPV